MEPLARHNGVHGGQQPVSGATLQLYVVGTTGDGSAATPLLTRTVTSDANGYFDITGAYTCPSPSTLVYITATGGNPGLGAGTNNAAIALMAALGTCGSLQTSTIININELTTVAAVWPLAPFISSYSSIGSGTADAAALASAFTLASEYVNTTTGTAPGLNVPAGTTIPVAQLNTLADILSTWRGSDRQYERSTDHYSYSSES
jgi:trimeric autotransporter adhesin